MKSQFFIFLSVLVCSTQLPVAKYALGGAVGGAHTSNNHYFAYSLYGFYKFDEQILLGIKSGQEQGGVPVTANLYMRIPFGRVFLPVLTGDLGYFFHKNNSAGIWKAGGGIDWKNGQRSSILITAGYQKIGDRPGLFSRIGLLLEF